MNEKKSEKTGLKGHLENLKEDIKEEYKELKEDYKKVSEGEDRTLLPGIKDLVAEKEDKKEK